jgi:hypothetical protein
MPSSHHPPRDLTGQTFGPLTVIRRAPGRYNWECVCVCGETVVAQAASIIRQTVKVCWCARRKRPNLVTVTHRDRA